MAGSGIWLGPDEYLQTQGQIWGQQQLQRVQSGEDWANQAIQTSMQRLQAMVPQMPPPAPAPPPAQTPVPAPTPAPVATPEPVAAPPQSAPPPAPVPIAPPPPPPPAPAPTPAPVTPTSTDMSAGQDWAQQAIANLTTPGGMQNVPGGAPGPAQGPTPSVPAPPAASTPGPSPAPSGAMSGPQPTTPGDLIDQTRQAAQAAGIDPDLFSRQIQQESNFNPAAVSGAGARGIAQFMPATAQGLGINPDDPSQALPAAANLMKSYLQKYNGDWASALSAYNAGPGNVPAGGGVPDIPETQSYVQKILGGAGQAVSGAVNAAVSAGQTAVNTVTQGVQSAVARVSQFGMGLSSGDAMAFCGPAAAMAFAQTYGRNPTVDEAKQLAQQVGWNSSQGMAGVESEVKLLNGLGVDAHATQGVDWAAVGRDASGGNPVIIDTPGHYYYLDGYNADSGKFHVGTSGTDLKGGSEWMSADQINAMPQSQGAARAAIFADHPLAQNDGLAQSTTAAQGSTSMTTMQPATQPASDLLSTVTGAVQSKAQDVMNAVQNVGNPLEAAFGTPEQPSGLSNAIMNNPLMQGVQAVNPVREALFPTILDPSVRAQQEQEDALGLSAFQKRLAGQGDQVTPEEQQAESNQMQRAQMIGLTMPNVGAVAQAVARPGNVPLSDWLRGAYRGGIIGGLNTAADVAFNASLTPALSGITGTVRDLASFQPGRLHGRLLGAQSGIVNWADNWLQGLRNSLNGPNTITARANPGAATWAGRVVEGMGAIHGAFQNATSELIESMEHGAESGANASATGANGAQWFQEFQNQFSQPVSATVKAMGDRAALRGDLGQLTGALGRLVGNMGPVGDALFPVYRMGMAMANRMVEFTPVGLAGTVADIGKAQVGRGPYAAGLGSTPASSAVGPLSERLTNNLLGTALSMWLANKALGGTITGAGPTDPGEHQVWLANGNQPNSFLGPDGAFHSWEHLPPALRGPLMTAGAYADAVQAYNASSAKQAATGPAAYGVEDPRMAAASQLISEVGQQLMSATPMRTFANLYDALQTGSVAGKAMGTASAVGSSVLGGLVPFSGEVRSIAQMTDPYQRQVVRPITPDLLQQSIAERVAENIPGLRQGLPVAQDVLGRPLQNPLQGLGELSPVRSAAGQPTAVLQAMQSAGVAPAATPDTVPYGRGEIRLNPQEQRAFEEYRGQIIQQYAGGLVASPQWQQMGQLAQQRSLSNIDQQAQAAAGRLVLRDIVAVGQGPSRMQFTGALAPVLGYGPDVLGNQALLQAELARSQTYRQTLMQALQGSGSSNLQQLMAANAAAASATQGP